MTASPDAFADVFQMLRPLLAAVAPACRVTVDRPDCLTLDLPPSARYPQGLFFGMVEIRRSYVSYHLMPVYIFPDLLAALSPALRRRMQGKSCFNFRPRQVDPELVSELAALTSRAFARCQEEGLA